MPGGSGPSGRLAMSDPDRPQDIESESDLDHHHDHQDLYALPPDAVREPPHSLGRAIGQIADVRRDHELGNGIHGVGHSPAPITGSFGCGVSGVVRTVIQV